MKHLVNMLIQRMGKTGYQLDEDIRSISLLIILLDRGCQAIRGLFLKLFLRSSSGLVFLGKNTKIRHAHLISAGKSLSIGDSVEINALCKQGVLLGRNVSILRNTIIECTGVIRDLGEGLQIGDYVGIAQNCFIQVRGPVIIGSRVILGPGVSIFSENHNIADLNVAIVDQGATRIGVTIEEGVWIGANSTILDGVTVGAHAVVAAGSLVNKDVPPFSVVGGVPAKILKNRREVG